MHKRFDFLDFVKIQSQAHELLSAKLLNSMLHYYHLKDIEINSTHESLFRALYVEPNQSYDLIAKRFYINVYTLDRYRQQYNRFALKIAPRKLVAKYQAIRGSV